MFILTLSGYSRAFEFIVWLALGPSLTPNSHSTPTHLPPNKLFRQFQIAWQANFGQSVVSLRLLGLFKLNVVAISTLHGRYKKGMFSRLREGELSRLC